MISYYFRWHKCTVITQKAFSAKVSQMYVAAHEGMETKRQTSKMIDNLKASFRKLLEAADWMDAGISSGILQLDSVIHFKIIFRPTKCMNFNQTLMFSSNK